jgi:hypothetical protein
LPIEPADWFETSQPLFSPFFSSLEKVKKEGKGKTALPTSLFGKGVGMGGCPSLQHMHQNHWYTVTCSLGNVSDK